MLAPAEDEVGEAAADALAPVREIREPVEIAFKVFSAGVADIGPTDPDAAPPV